MSFLSNLGVPEILVGIGAICSLVGTVWMGIQQGKEQIQNRDKIIEEQRNLVTGGDGYWFLRPTMFSNSNDILLLPEFKSNYPLFDVSITGQEFDLTRDQNGNLRYQPSNSFQINLGTVHPLTMFATTGPLKSYRVPTNPNEEFAKKIYMKISARNGFIEETIHLRRHQGKYTQAFKVIQWLPKYGDARGFDTEKIFARYKSIDADFPMAELDERAGDTGWDREYERH